MNGYFDIKYDYVKIKKIIKNFESIKKKSKKYIF